MLILKVVLKNKTNTNIEFISSEYYYNNIYNIMGEFIKKEAKEDLVINL